MPIDWKQDLETGIEEIDNQHRSIFDKINVLMEAVQARRGKEEVGKTIDFLGDYVVTHFAAEEKFMAVRQYPNLAAHRAAHILFLNDFQILKGQFDREGASLSLVFSVQRQVVDWLFEHIRGTDKAMAAYVRNQPRPSGSKEKPLS